MTLGGSDDDRTAFDERGEVGLRGGRVVHPAVHGRGKDERRAVGEGGDGQQIIGETVRQFGERVGGAGRNDEGVGLMRQPDVEHVRFAAPQIGLGVGAAASDRLKGERRDKFFPRFGKDHVHQRSRLRQLGRQVGGFVDRDGTRHTEKDMFIGKDGHGAIILPSMKGKRRKIRS